MTERMLIPKIIFKKLPSDTLGEWVAPKGLRAAKPGTIYVDYRLSGLKKMETLIHELLHEFLPDLSEEKVGLTALLIAKALGEQGYKETIE